MIHVANLREMCELLRIDESTGAKHWRKWPHFFATDGRDARSVRFIPERVIEALEQSNGRIDVQDKGRHGVSAILDDSEITVSDKIGPQIGPRFT